MAFTAGCTPPVAAPPVPTATSLATGPATSSSIAPSSDGVDSNANLSEADAQSLRAKFLSDLARNRGITNPPEVGFVRWTDPSTEPKALATCITQLGFRVEVTEGGWRLVDQAAAAQPQAYSLAIYTCLAEYSPHPYYSLPQSPAALGRLYDWYVAVSVPCLEKNGHHTTAPPSRQVWIAAQRSGTVSWLPYMTPSIEKLPSDELSALSKICPQGPDPNTFLEHLPVIAH